MQLTIQTRLSNPNGRGAEVLNRLARTSIEDFFRYSPVELSRLELVTLAAERGGNARKLVKVIPQREEARLHNNAVSVNLYAEGTQGVIGFLIAEGFSAAQLEDLIEKGPYNLKPRRRAASKTEGNEVSEALAESVCVPGELTAIESPTVTVAMETQSPSIVQGDKSVDVHANRLTPREKLVRARVEAEEIDRLMATLSAIIYREVELQGLVEVPSTLRVSVESISQAIMDHMKLPYSRAGNYKGIIGSFYASRISLFALKYEYVDEPSDAQYADWLFDCNLVLDFVGGRDQLAALALCRMQEVEDRVASETTRIPTPEAKVVEQAAQESFFPDNSLFDLALRFLAGRDEAVAEQQLAEANLKIQVDRVEALKQQLREAEQAAEAANVLVAEAKKKVTSLTLSEAAKTRIRAAKERLDALASRLGI